jgi:hypothetical protein
MARSRSRSTRPARSTASRRASGATFSDSAPSDALYPRALVASQLARVRELCHRLPDVTERPSHGSPTFFVNDKRTFAYFLDNHHGDGRLALWCAAPDGAQAMLVDSDPDGFFLPPYVARLGWIGVRLDRDVPWNRIAMVLEAAHQTRYRPPRVTSVAPRAGASRRRRTANKRAR